jgi:hypothetical protein
MLTTAEADGKRISEPPRRCSAGELTLLAALIDAAAELSDEAGLLRDALASQPPSGLAPQTLMITALRLTDLTDQLVILWRSLYSSGD